MLFDTDVLIWALRGSEKAAREIDEDTSRFISAVNYMELMQGARDKREQSLIKQFLNGLGFVVLPITEAVSHRATIFIEEYALNLAISGKTWKGFELGTTTTKRRYSDEFEVARVVRNAGFDPYETKVMPISAMTKMLGKKRFDDIVGPYVMKPEGKPKLVKRKEN